MDKSILKSEVATVTKELETLSNCRQGNGEAAYTNGQRHIEPEEITEIRMENSRVSRDRVAQLPKKGTARSSVKITIRR
jgi:hypothetical protein